MKKIFILAIAVVMLSGCSANSILSEEKENNKNVVPIAEQEILTFKNPEEKDLLYFVLALQSLLDDLTAEKTKFLDDSVDKELLAIYAVNGSDVPLMRYIGGRNLNDFKVSNYEGRIKGLEDNAISDDFSGTVRLLRLSYDFLYSFNYKITDLKSFQEFKQDFIDFQSYYETLDTVGQTFVVEYDTFKNLNPNLDFKNTDGLYSLIKFSYTSVDSDNDGLTDEEELTIYNSDPNNPDTDGDGFSDGAEARAGYNPLGEGGLRR